MIWGPFLHHLHMHIKIIFLSLNFCTSEFIIKKKKIFLDDNSKNEEEYKIICKNEKLLKKILNFKKIFYDAKKNFEKFFYFLLFI